MKILLVNDDGYQAEGIRTLERILLEYGHEVMMNAPKSQMSGKSHAMTFGGPVRITRFAHEHYYTEGTPTDCILFARRYGLFDREPDLVISGINNGYNLASDIIYSGTCGAAREAVLSGFKAIALSCEGGGYERASRFVCENLDKLYPLLGVDSFLNLNFPPDFNGGMKKAIPGDVRYFDKVSLLEKKGETITLLIDNVVREEHILAGGINDLEVVKEGFASASFVSIYSYIDKDRQDVLEDIL